MQINVIGFCGKTHVPPEGGLVVAKKAVILMLIATLLGGCVPGLQDEETKIVKENEKGNEKPVNITPEVETTEKYYRSVVDFTAGAARGLITYGVANRLDIDELETGLMRFSKNVFPVDTYIFQPGQYLSGKTIESWLERESKDNPQGLAPKLPKNFSQLSVDQKHQYFRKHPSYLSYIVEQNYLRESADGSYKLGGISLALSMNKVYYYEFEDRTGKIYEGQVPLDHEKVVEMAKKYAQVILERLRQMDGLRNVPVLIALYQEEVIGSAVPGNYFARTVVEAGEATISEWEKVNENYMLLTSDEAEDKHPTDAEKFDNFQEEIQKVFPNHVGVIGTGFYKNGELVNLKIEIPIRFYSEAEIISFTQYVAGKVMERHFPFSRDVSIQVYITSLEHPEAVIVRKPGMNEPFIHVMQ